MADVDVDTFILLLLSEKMADADVDTFLLLLLLSSYRLTVKRDAGAASIRPRAGFLRYSSPQSRSRDRRITNFFQVFRFLFFS